MSSISKLVEGLTTPEEILQAVAPDPTARDRAVWEAARLHYQNWRPRINIDADNGHDFLYLEESRVKELMKRLVVQMMDIPAESTVKEIVVKMMEESNSPEEFLFCMITLSNFAGSAGIQFLQNEQ